VFQKYKGKGRGDRIAHIILLAPLVKILEESQVEEGEKRRAEKQN
jgi:hypothetical protein